jgi:hypothetical protein
MPTDVTARVAAAPEDACPNGATSSSATPIVAVRRKSVRMRELTG